jgi:hypothetical protein
MVGGTFAARFVGLFGWRDALCFGILMNTKG